MAKVYSFAGICNLYLFLLLFLFFSNGFAQSDSLYEAWSEFNENESGLADLLQQLRDDPVNLNFATKEELLNIPFISETLADSILALRKRLNGLRSKRELKSVLGTELYRLLKDFFVVRRRRNANGLFDHKNSYVLSADPEAQTYAGNRLYDYNKIDYRFSPSVRAGLVSQKDAGEESFWDYLSGFISYESENIQLVLGKFRFRFGEGLSFADPFAGQKSALVISPFNQRSNGGLANLSSSENSGLFGLYASAFFFHSSRFYFFYSHTLRDIRTSPYTSDITGINYTGYHRTVLERQRKNGLNEKSLGFAYRQRIFKYLQLSTLFSRYRYNPPIVFNPMTVGESAFRRQRYKFSGAELRQFGLAYQSIVGQTRLNGELSACNLGGPAFAQSYFYDGRAVQFGLKYWRVSRDFQSPYGRVFADNRPFPQGVEGIYAAIQFRPFPGWRIKAYRLMQKALWRNYTDPMPGTKNEWLLQLEKKYDLGQSQIRLRQKEEQEYGPQTAQESSYRKSRQVFLRLQTSFRPLRAMRLTARYAFTYLQKAKEQGRYFFQDFRYLLFKPLLLKARVTFFRSDSYLSRLYEYEADLPGSFSNYALFGRGFVWYILLKCSPLHNLTLRLKFRYFRRWQTEVRNALFYEPQRALKRSLRLQIRFTF